MDEKTRREHPVWELYDLLRDARYYNIFFTEECHRLKRNILWSDVLIAVFSSTSGIASYSYFQGNKGMLVWTFGSFVAAIIAILKPILGLAAKLELYTDLYSGYRDLFHECKELTSYIKTDKKYSNSHIKSYKALKQKEMSVTHKRPPILTKLKRRKLIQQKVNNEFPSKTFYIP